MQNIKSFLFDYRRNIDRQIEVLQASYKNREKTLLALDQLFEVVREKFSWDQTSVPQVNEFTGHVEMNCWVPLKLLSAILQELADASYFPGEEIDGLHVPTVFSWDMFTFSIRKDSDDGFILSSKY